MKIKILSFILLVLLSNCQDSSFEGDYSAGLLVYTTTDKIINSKQLFKEFSDYLTPTGPLSPLGPLGTNGILGSNGVLVSSKPPSDWFGLLFEQWHVEQLFISEIGGHLNDGGPLGENSPGFPSQYYGDAEPSKTIYKNNKFAPELRGFGIFSALGPIGPLGPLGLAGPLGPEGLHGFKTNSNGEYVDGNGNVIRKVEVGTGANRKTHSLFEVHSKDYALSTTLDSSVMIIGNHVGDDDFQFNSEYNEIVTLMVISESLNDTFNLELRTKENVEIAESNSKLYVNMIQFKAKQNQNYFVKVIVGSTVGRSNLMYRLTILGSSPYLNMRNNNGRNVITYG